MSNAPPGSSSRSPWEYLKGVPPVLTALATFMTAGAAVFGVLVSTGVISLSRHPKSGDTTTPATRGSPSASRATGSRTLTVESGTDLYVTVGRQVTSGTTERFDGSVQQDVIVGGKVVIPAGSRVKGGVAPLPAQATAATALLLGFDTIVVGGTPYALSASYDTSVAAKGGVSAAAGEIIGQALGKKAQAISKAAGLGDGGQPIVLPASTTIRARIQRSLTLQTP